jgi:hypothetical protein
MQDDQSIKYRGNPNLKPTGIKHEWSPEQVNEFVKCSQDIEYFIRNYYKIVAPGRGVIDFIPHAYQIRMIEAIKNNRFVICKIPRQYGKTSIVAAILLWYALFNDHFKIALLAHKAAQAREIMSRIKLGFEFLPRWLQQGIVKWNEGDIIFENGSLIQAEATSAGSVRGRSYDIVYADELSHVALNEQEDFYTSTFPTITSSETTKMIVTSTPKGMELFYRLWTESERGKNDFVRVEAFWWDIPGRDEEWKAAIIRNTSERQFEQEYICSFLSSMNTLIDGHKIGNIVTETPVAMYENDNLWVYHFPEPEHQYVITVDTSHGKELDYSVFVVFDVTKLPYRIVAKFRSNTIPSIFYADVILRAARFYSNAYVLIESNDQGKQVGDILFMDLEYENVFMTRSNGRKGQELSGGFGDGTPSVIGIRTSTATKRIGCSSLKTLIEMDKLIVNDEVIKTEMTTFVAVNNSYQAEPGRNDDCMMCLVLFAWLVNQPYFREMFSTDVRQDILQTSLDLVHQNLTPFGFIVDGREEPDEYGVVWNTGLF